MGFLNYNYYNNNYRNMVHLINFETIKNLFSPSLSINLIGNYNNCEITCSITYLLYLYYNTTVIKLILQLLHIEIVEFEFKYIIT